MSELIHGMEEIICSSDTTPVFMMKDLKSKFQQILTRLGAASESIEGVNVTRLKDQLLAEIPSLTETKKGKFTILTMDQPLGKAIHV